jgi:hypothetical protein
MAQEHGIWVHQGQAPSGFNWDRIVDIGGRIYDALHLRRARQAACDRVYTFNVRHFQQLAPDLAGRIGAPSSFL